MSSRKSRKPRAIAMRSHRIFKNFYNTDLLLENLSANSRAGKLEHCSRRLATPVWLACDMYEDFARTCTASTCRVGYARDADRILPIAARDSEPPN